MFHARNAVLRWVSSRNSSPEEPEAMREPQRQTGREVVIVEAARTPIGRGHREKGYYRDIHPNELLGSVYKAVIERSGIDAELVDDVVAGAVSQVGEQSN